MYDVITSTSLNSGFLYASLISYVNMSLAMFATQHGIRNPNWTRPQFGIELQVFKVSLKFYLVFYFLLFWIMKTNTDTNFPLNTITGLPIRLYPILLELVTTNYQHIITINAQRISTQCGRGDFSPVYNNIQEIIIINRCILLLPISLPRTPTQSKFQHYMCIF